MNSCTINRLRRCILSSLGISTLIPIDIKYEVRLEFSPVRKELRLIDMQCRKQSPSPGIGNCWHPNAFKMLVNLSLHFTVSGLEYWACDVEQAMGPPDNATQMAWRCLRYKGQRNFSHRTAPYHFTWMRHSILLNSAQNDKYIITDAMLTLRSFNNLIPGLYPLWKLGRPLSCCSKSRFVNHTIKTATHRFSADNTVSPHSIHYKMGKWAR